MTAEREDHNCRHIDRQCYRWDQTGEQSQDTQPQISGFGIRRHELLSFDLLRVQKAYQRSSEDAFVDDAVQPVDGFLRLLEKSSDFAQHQLKGDRDERDDTQYAESQPPVDGEQQHACPDDKEQRRDDRREGLRYEHFHGIHIGREIRQEFGRRDLLYPSERLHGNFRGEASSQVSGNAFRGPRLDNALRVCENENKTACHKELQDYGMEDEVARSVGVDGAGDQLRYYQVQTVPDDSERDQRGDHRFIGLKEEE